MILETAVVLAGGLGTRLAPLTNNCPKPLVSINEQAFIRYLLHPLREQGIKRVIVLTGYLSEQFEQHFANHPVEGMEVICEVGELEWDTGKRLSEASTICDFDKATHRRQSIHHTLSERFNR